MQPRILLLRYNKVTNQAIDSLLETDSTLSQADLSAFGSKIDTASFQQISEFLGNLLPIKSVMIGDIFWPTGQNICRWCSERKIDCFFLQHGQWIYVDNKKNPKFLPSYTFVYGDDLLNEISDWPYGKRSKIVTTGNPRYDNLRISCGDYVYFSPPILMETNPSSPTNIHQKTYLWLKSIAGIDTKCNLLIQPHYREGDFSFLRKTFPAATMVDKQDSALDYIGKCSKVLTHRNSTVVLDAIACRKKVILMNFEGFDNGFFKKHYFGEFAVENKSLADLEKSITNEYLQVDSYEEKAKRYIYLGNAGQRILRIMKYGIDTHNTV